MIPLSEMFSRLFRSNWSQPLLKESLKVLIGRSPQSEEIPTLARRTSRAERSEIKGDEEISQLLDRNQEPGTVEIFLSKRTTRRNSVTRERSSRRSENIKDKRDLLKTNRAQSFLSADQIEELVDEYSGGFDNSETDSHVLDDEVPSGGLDSRRPRNPLIGRSNADFYSLTNPKLTCTMLNFLQRVRRLERKLSTKRY